MPNHQILLNDTIFSSYKEKDSYENQRSPSLYLDDSIKNMKYNPTDNKLLISNSSRLDVNMN